MALTCMSILRVHGTTELLEGRPTTSADINEYRNKNATVMPVLSTPCLLFISL